MSSYYAIKIHSENISRQALILLQNSLKCVRLRLDLLQSLQRSPGKGGKRMGRESVKGKNKRRVSMDKKGGETVKWEKGQGENERVRETEG